MLRNLILKNRSYRRFYQSRPVPEEQVREWIDLARNSASAGNSQPLKYIISAEASINVKIFETLAWAGYLSDWAGPEDGERPSAYIIMLHDTLVRNKYLCDDGIAAQSILLGAVESGFGGCIIHSVNRIKLRDLLKLQDHLEIIQVIALGRPKETVVLEKMCNDDVKYWRDENQVHHVPKRSLDEIILKIKTE